MIDPISVLIPVWNREKYIKECIDSILQQTFPKIEILILDDCSDDNTVKIIKSIDSDKIKLFQSDVRLGIPKARNFLLSKCNTKYATWQDSDDLSNIHRISLQYQAIRNNKNSFVRCGFRRFGSCEKIDITEEPKEGARSLSYDMFSCDNIIYFNELRKFNEKYIQWLKAMKKTFNMLTLNKVLYYYRIHDKRITSMKKHRTL